MSEIRQFCTFCLGDLFLGVEVGRVQEVLRHQSLTDVPLSRSLVAGLINLRGQIVTALDLRQRFELPATDLANVDEDSESPMNVVVRHDGEAVALIVDSIGDVLEIDERTFEPTPSTVRGVARDLVRGIHKLEGRLMLVLDVDRALECIQTVGTR